MNIFIESDYRKLIRKMVEERKGKSDALTLDRLAKSANMQKAHLTNVLNGRANLQPDQIFMISRRLGLNADESKYLGLLLEQERSAISERKEALNKEIARIQEKYERTEAHLHSDKTLTLGVDEVFPEYYLDPIHQLVHIALSVEKFRAEPELLTGVLGISENRLRQVLERLQKNGIIDGKLKNLRRNLHLKKESPLYSAWRSQIVNLGLAAAKNETDDSRYGFTVVFSADVSAAKSMRAKILELIKSMEGDVQKAPAKSVYQFSVDLMKWG